MKITFLTVFPDLVKHVSEAAKTIDPSHDLPVSYTHLRAHET